MGFENSMRRAPIRVCLITPGHVSTNPRLAKEADALSLAGFDVQVVAGDYLDWGREADGGFEGRDWRIAQKVCFGPLAPLAIRARQGVRIRLARQCVKSGLSGATLVEAAWHPASRELATATVRVAADLYIAHYPAALPAAARAARLHGGRYAFDAEDFHLGEPPDDKSHDFQRMLTRLIEEKYLPGAAYVTAASPDIAQAYAETYRLSSSVVLNVFSLSDAPATTGERGAASPSLYWFSQTIGPDRGLECALHAIARAKSKPHLFLRGASAQGYQETLCALAEALGCRERLHFLAPEAPAKMAQLAAIYDVGLAAEPGHTQNNQRALSNKLFTYLLAGLPVMLSDTIAQSRFAAECGECLKLYSRDDPQSLSTALDGLLLQPEKLASARRAAFDLAHRRYNWEIESEMVIDLVRRATQFVPQAEIDECGLR
jgi:glycosyltransferase involved in cell wall biosynthesis